MKTVDKEGYQEEKLEPGKKLEFEITGKRRCTGYWNEDRQMKKCPDFAKINRGNQCPRCKSKDIYNKYVEGKGKSPRDKESHSVYLAQSGTKIKVGVVRTGRLMHRWIEQGADYATQIEKDLTSTEALKLEKKISQKEGIPERIRKEHKIQPEINQKEKLKEKLKELGRADKEIEDINSKTIYPKLEPRKLQRTGLFNTELHTVKGNILANNKQAIGLTEGKIMSKPSQKGLKNYS